MPSSVSRRTIAKGAAWSVPVVAIGAAAPLATASPTDCPSGATLVSASATGSGSNKTWTVTVTFTGLDIGTSYSASISVTDSKGTGGSGFTEFTATDTTQNHTFIAVRHDNGSTTSITSITYSITPLVAGGTACTGSVTL